ncbi:DUF4241 domain-containing protein [Micromonospora sp. NBC_00860]|uniref:DUF4241 domain-containing protein n=1 Tax=Micromonospora sp. NBC_00860 TaxID=2975980 RepID=UPI0038653696|nr:DUF4241 domain-containing protein [Micromonospora sp. NBC_00860]WTA68205.1 DUF4241 domain-containing protein [Micromonospora sp. NBC_00855]
MPYTPDLDRLLTPGARFTDQHGAYLIEAHAAGDVVLPTGQVVGCDPLVCPEAEPFTVTVPPGRYAARAWVAVVLREDAEVDRRVAAFQLVVSDEPTTRWEPAVAGDQDVATLGADDYFGYGVDAGAGTLADPTALSVLEGWDYDRVEQVFIPDKLPSSPVPGLITAVLDEASGANVVTVTTGWGDGCYGTWIGRAADGRVTSFVTDFMVVPE